MSKADIGYVQFTVDRQKLLLVKFITIGMSQVPKVFANDIRRRSIEQEVLMINVTTSYRHGSEIKTLRSRFWGSDFFSITLTTMVENMIKILLYNQGSKICLLLEYLYSNCNQYYQSFHLISIGNIGKINICKTVQGYSVKLVSLSFNCTDSILKVGTTIKI